jgi:hypothetical protein
MGNRATVVFSTPEFKVFSPAIFLHWNGGLESLVGFMDEMERRKIVDWRCMEGQCSGFIHIVGDFFSGYGYQCAESGKYYHPYEVEKAGSDEQKPEYAHLKKVRATSNFSLGVGLFDPKDSADWDCLDLGDNDVFVVVREWIKVGVAKVRYFRPDIVGVRIKFVELGVDIGPATVKAAEAHKYRQEFRAFFQEDRPHIRSL